MKAYVVGKLVQVPLILLGVIVVMFFIIHLAPGDPVAVLVGDTSPPQEYIDELRHRLGLDRTLPEQLWIYILQVAQGDLGYSFYYNEPVLSLILQRIPVTLLLLGTSLIVATILGIILGVLAAYRPDSWLDVSANVTALVAYSIPVFWLGQLALLFFGLGLGWFPTQGTQSIRGSPEGIAAVLDRLHHLVLPAVVLGTRYVAIDFRLTRAGVMEVLSQEYIMTARAKGLGGITVLFRHALRNALLPLITITGLNVAFALSGAVLTEVIFGWPGMGRLTLEAIRHRDYPVLMGIFVLTTLLVVAINFVTDLLYAAIDPRIRVR